MTEKNEIGGSFLSYIYRIRYFCKKAAVAAFAAK